MTKTYMVIERFKYGDPKPIYKRFSDKGRMAPDGLNYITSWINEDMDCCYQIMETSDHSLLNDWMNNWKDIIDFEVFPVITSKEVMERLGNSIQEF